MRLIKTMTYAGVPSALIDLYKATGNEDEHMDESDLIIFRLMGADFQYSAVEFEEVNPDVLEAVFDAF